MGSSGSKPFADSSARSVIMRRTAKQVVEVPLAAKAEAEILQNILITKESTVSIQSHIPTIDKAESLDLSKTIDNNNSTMVDESMDPNILKEVKTWAVVKSSVDKV